IACRMKLSIFDIPAGDMKRLNDQLINALRRETLFGTGANFRKPMEHEVLDEDWSITPVTKRVFDKARGQLGTSGSGNHFVEFGVLTVEREPSGSAAGPNEEEIRREEKIGTGAIFLPPGQYL